MCVFLQDAEAEGNMKNELDYQDIKEEIPSEILATTLVILKVRLNNKCFLLCKNEEQMPLYSYY